MDWDEIFPRYDANCYGNPCFIDNDNLKAHLIVSWVCIEILQKEVKELARKNDILWSKIIERCDE